MDTKRHHNFLGSLLWKSKPLIQTGIFSFVVDNGGSVVTTGAKKAYFSVPYDCAITKWRIIPDQSGSIVFDIWKDTYANFPPVVGDSITAADKPTLTTTTKAESSALTGWSPNLSLGDILEIAVDSATTVTKARLELFVVTR